MVKSGKEGDSDPSNTKPEPVWPAVGAESAETVAAAGNLHSEKSEDNGRITSTTRPQRLRKRVRPRLVLAVLLMVVAVVLAVFRIRFVTAGVLYGTSAVAQVDVIVAGLAALSGARLVYVWPRRKPASAAAAAESAATATEPAEPGAARESRSPAGPTDWAARLTALGSVGALLISGLNLFVPVEVPAFAKPACPSAQVRNAQYVGVTSATNGVNSRSGPARSNGPNGRFPNDCSIGFSSYCPGESIEDPSGTTAEQRWVTSRWLVVAKQPAGFDSWLAGVLSGEKPGEQFVSDAYITPENPYDQLKPAGDCPGNYLPPGKAVLAPIDPTQDTLTARADHAANMGFAVWIPPGQGFTDENGYHPIYNKHATRDQNPGSTAVDGSKKVTWFYHGSLLVDLSRTHAASTPAVVVVMAVPCIADNLPASSDLAATVAYDIASGSEPRAVASVPQGYSRDRLARTACQANS